jgi:hypothetical protein
MTSTTTKEGRVVNSKLLTGFALGISFASIQSCNRKADIPEAQLHKKASTLGVADRYELYLQVYKSRIPENPILAGDVAKLGDPARKYAFARASKSNAAELGAILELVSQFDAGCSESEYETLVSAADRISTTSGELAAFRRSIDGVCKGVLPPGVRR